MFWGISQIMGKSDPGDTGQLPEHCRFLACPRWPRELLEAFCISGNIYRVTIV
ncbi:hypothetical protein B0H67DRAFT_595838 [Lasiosphaeris hirsuta]|uniref:Uncharacterized protein n=1 Tax=Lasiosphaeris hirsuta TaxID=260670 RepID=A0AA39ZPR9_9PEZI|nr:hypothetical protein B0H67DRAFT_595838 [Lasiosphaeris hirsuta]